MSDGDDDMDMTTGINPDPWSRSSISSYEFNSVFNGSNKTIPKPFRYTLKIEDFTELSEMFKNYDASKYYTDDFMAFGKHWCLKLYPNGHKPNENHVALYLECTEQFYPASDYWELNLMVKFFVYDQTRDNYLVIEDGEVKNFSSMQLDTFCGCSQLISLSVFEDERYGYLVDDICYFGVEIHQVKLEGIVKTLKVSRISAGVTFAWKIEGFSNLEPKYYYSNVFLVDKFKWKLRVKSSGENNDSLSLYLGLELESPESFPRNGLVVDYQLSIKNQLLGTYFTREGSNRFHEDHLFSGFDRLIPLSKLYNEASGYRVSDSVIVEAKIIKIEFLTLL